MNKKQKVEVAKFTAETREGILDAISEGGNLVTICAKPGMPSRATLYNWLKSDRDFAAQYHLATTIRRLSMIDRILEIADTIPEDADSSEVQRIRTQLDTYKWASSRVESSPGGLFAGTATTLSKADQKAKLAEQLQIALDNGMSLEEVIEELRRDAV